MVSAALLFAALQVRGHPARWLQSYTALLGAGALFGLISLAYRGLASLFGAGWLAELLDLSLFVWSLAVMGHILRHALEIPLAMGVAALFCIQCFYWGWWHNGCCPPPSAPE